GALIKEFTTNFNKTDARYVRVKVKSVGVCPDWHTGAGGKVWLFCDEIQIY
ncbi:unnamed protein product, partial [marine sediment metagenome]